MWNQRNQKRPADCLFLFLVSAPGTPGKRAVPGKSDLDEFVLPGAQPKLLCMLRHTCHSVSGVDGVENIPVAAVAALVIDGGVAERRLGQHRIGTGLIQRHGVEGQTCPRWGRWAHRFRRGSRSWGRRPAPKRYMEAGTPVHHGLGILGNLLVEGWRVPHRPGAMASLGADGQHRAQPTHLSVLMVALPSGPNSGASWAQILAQAWQPMHFF